MAFEVSDPAGHMAARRRAVHDGLHGQINGECSTRAMPLKSATCVATRDAVPTSPVRSSNQLEEFQHDHDHKPSRQRPRHGACARVRVSHVCVGTMCCACRTREIYLLSSPGEQENTRAGLYGTRWRSARKPPAARALPPTPCVL